MIYLVEVTAITDSAGTSTVLRYSSDEYITGPSESPANTYYEPRVKTPADITRNLFSSGTTSGASRVGYGVVELSNADGELDFLANYGFDGRPLVIKVGDVGVPYANFTTVLSGTMEQVEFTFQTVTILARDKLAVLELPLQKSEFLGTNSNSDTSTSSNTIGTGTKTFVLVYGTAFAVGSVVMAYQTSTPANYMIGTVTSYTSGTKTLVINSLYTAGTGTITAWTVAQVLTGVEGTTDIVGLKKPLLYGTAYNFSPPVVNTSKLVYQVSDSLINDVSNVYDRGAVLTKGADYTNVSNMMFTAPSAGTYRVCKTSTGSYFRLGTNPAGTITCDATQGATAADKTAAQLIKTIAIKGGVSSGDINASDVTALDALNSAEVGIWVFGDDQSLSVIDQIAQSVGAWYGYDATGQFRMARFDAASGAADIEISDDNIISIETIRPTDTDRGLPAYKVILNYLKNYTIQTSDLATSVSPTRRNVIKFQNSSGFVENATIKTQFMFASEITRNTLLINSVAASTEASRILALYQEKRTMYQVKIALDVTETLPDLNDVANVTLNRFGLNAGKLFRVIGISSNYANNRATLTLWG